MSRVIHSSIDNQSPYRRSSRAFTLLRQIGREKAGFCGKNRAESISQGVSESIRRVSKFRNVLLKIVGTRPKIADPSVFLCFRGRD